MMKRVIRGPTKVAAIDEESDNKQIEGANLSGIVRKEEVPKDGSLAIVKGMTSELLEVQDAREISHYHKRQFTIEYAICEEALQYEVCKGYRMGKTTINGQVVVQKIDCSILKMSDSIDAQYQQDMSRILGETAVKVIFVDENFVVLKEIKLDFKSWYLDIYKKFEGESSDDWWKHIKSDLKKLLRGIMKSMVKLSPNYSHGNWMKGIAIFNGEGKLYNMKRIEKEGYLRDAENLHDMILHVLLRSFDDSGHKWSTPNRNSMRFYENLSSKEFATFMFNLKTFIKQKKELVFYHPFFWSHNERMHFMEKIYDIFWLEKNFPLNYGFLKKELDQCFPLNWSWWTLLPLEGPLRKVFEYIPGGEVAASQQNAGEDIFQARRKNVYSIVFWRHCRNHYNDHLSEESGKTIEEIEIELTEKFDICGNVCMAIYKFIDKASRVSSHGALLQRLIALREEIGFVPVIVNA